MDPLENNHKQRRWLITAIVVVVAALVTVFLLRRGKGDTVERYRSEVVDRGNVAQTVSATGTLSAVTTVQVGSQVSGIISKLYVDFNTQVKKGELLAELDPTPFQQQVDQRKADVAKSRVQVANQKITYGRQQKMLEAGLIAQSDLDAAKAAYDASVADLDLSQAALRQAETNLGYAKIFSPIDGEVVARQYDIGQTVAASFQAPTLFIIAKDLTKMQVQADVDQSDIGQIKVDEAARFTVDAYPEQQFRGRIAQVRLNATVNQNVITYPVMIEVPNPDGKLRPSMTANVTIEVAQVRDVLRVPNAALRFRPETKEGAAKAATPRTAGTPGATPTAATATAQQTPAAGAPPSFDRGAAGLGERGQGMAGVERAFSAGAGGKPAARRQAQTVYVVDDKGALRPVTIRTGITDGHYTQVLQTVDGTLNPGDKVAIGLATAKVDSGQQGARPPGMGRF